MNVLQALKSISGYPIPATTLQDIAAGCGLDANGEVTEEMRTKAEFKRAKAKVYLYLSEAPNVSQGGISYSFSESERNRFRMRAKSILNSLGETDESLNGQEYGYQGEDL
ncbi:hypothetical protein EVA_06627 [gut metagenome]|uniref:Uncharacterized protein n=1 Tax=gut metagenome TaxID=749906 RepID=J9CYE0_9ZZZZ